MNLVDLDVQCVWTVCMVGLHLGLSFRLAYPFRGLRLKRMVDGKRLYSRAVKTCHCAFAWFNCFCSICGYRSDGQLHMPLSG